LRYRPSALANRNEELTVPQAIRAQSGLMHEAMIRFDRSWKRDVPDHWHTAGARTPRNAEVGHKRPKGAQTPAHATFNYLYAILETEATIAAHRMGFESLAFGAHLG
jgi:hypothetical protein